MRLDIIQDEAGFAALEPVWDTLLDQSATHTPFLAWDWVRLWWEEARSHFELCIGVVRDDSDVVLGIAPFVIGQDRDGSRQHLRHLGFMNGLGELQGERLDLLVPAGREAEITTVLVSVISQSRPRWDVVRLNKVPTESMNYSYLLAEMRWAGSGASVLNKIECRCIDLPTTWEGFEKMKSASFRRNTRRYWQALLTKHGGQAMVSGEGRDVATDMQRFMELHAMHWPDGVSSFLKPAARRLHEKLSAKWLPEGRAMLPMIFIDGKMAGAVYTICHQGEMMVYQLGWDPQYASISMGNLSIRYSVQMAIEKGLKTFDLLPGDYRYKHDWSTTARYLSDLECFHPFRLRALLFRTLRTLKRWYKKPKPAAAPAQESKADSAE